MKAISFVLGMFVVLSGLVLIAPSGVIRQASADSPELIYSDATADGYIEALSAYYPPDSYTAYDAGDLIYVGQVYAWPGNYYLYRGFLSFDTSVIPDNAIVQSATISIYSAGGSVDGGLVPPFAVDIYASDYGATLEIADWGTVGAYQGRLDNPLGGFSIIGISPSSIDILGLSGYVVKSTRDLETVYEPTGDEYVVLLSGDFAADDAFKPTLTVTYVAYGSVVTLKMTDGTTYPLGVYPAIEPWNLTYNRWCYEVDTIPDAMNLTIETDSNWEYLSSFPKSNVTVNPTNVTLDDVADSVTYRIWFAVPMTDPTSDVHVSYYNSFTGEGFAWETLRLKICGGTTWSDSSSETLASPDFEVSIYQSYTIRITDYFNNSLVDYSFTANTASVFVNIPVPIYSWQIFNQNDAPILMSIYWNNSGSPWQFFVGPHWIIERNLKGGDYTFMTTFYNTDGTAGETVYFNRTVPMTGLNASFVYVNGTTLYEIVSSVQGVMASQEIITSLISPSMVLVYENLPTSPTRMRSLSLMDGVAIDPYLILEATTFWNGTGTAITLGSPYPSLGGASYSMQTDVLTFTGGYSTWVFVNSSAGTELYSSTYLPASVVLTDATNITIWTNQTVAVSRSSTWREMSEYTVTYYATPRQYTAVLSLNNSMTVAFYQPYWFVGFPGNTSIDLESVSVYDLDNGIYLNQRTNFEVTAGGVHLTLSTLNASAVRNFRITYWDANGSSDIGAPNLIVYGYTTGTLNGVLMKYTSAQWVNPYSVAYTGQLYITLNFTDGDKLNPSSITIVDESTGASIPSSNYIYTGRTLIILTAGVGTVGIGQGQNFGIYFAFDTEATPKVQRDFFFDPISIGGSVWYIGGMGISLFFVVLALAWGVVGMAFWKGRKESVSWFVITVSVTIIGFYFQGALP